MQGFRRGRGPGSGNQGPGSGNHGPATGMTGRPRNAAGWQVQLACAHAAAGDPGAAASVGAAALPGVLELFSTRVRNHVGRLDRALEPHARVAEVSDFRDRVREARLA